MGIVTEPGEEGLDGAIDHGVHADDLLELALLLIVGQFTVQQQVGSFEKIRLFRQLLDGVAAVKENAVLAVDIGDFADASGRGGETGIISEITLAEKRGNIDDRLPESGVVHVQFEGLLRTFQGQIGFLVTHEVLQ